MSKWVKMKIADCLVDHWAGVWGTDPADNPTSRVFRSTEIDDDGHLDLAGGVEREIPTTAHERAIRIGDILLEASGGTAERPVGRVALVARELQERSFCSNFIRVLRPKTHIDSQYLAMALVALSRSPLILRFQQQTTGIINLAVKDYLRHEIFLPATKCEQTRRSKIFISIDRQIAATEHLIEKYEQIRAGLMQDLFTRGIDATGRLRPPRELAPELYHWTALGWLPNGWLPSKLRTLLQAGPKNGYSPMEAVEWTGVQTLGLSCLTPSGYAAKHKKNVHISSSIKQQFALNDGDFLITRSNTPSLVGLCGRYRAEETPCIYPDLMMRLRLDKALIDHGFAEQLLLSPIVRRSITAAAVGTSGSMVKLNAHTLGELQLPIPADLGEQETISSILQEQWSRISTLAEALRKLRHVRTALLHDLLTPPAADAAVPRIAAE